MKKILMVLVFGTLVAQGLVVPAATSRHVAGSARVLGVGKVNESPAQMGNIDFYQFQAGGCPVANVADGVQAGVINVVPNRGQKVTLRVTTASNENTKFSPYLGFAACGSADAFVGPVSAPCGQAALTIRHSCSFIVPAGATYLIVLLLTNFGDPSAVPYVINTIKFTADFAPVK